MFIWLKLIETLIIVCGEYVNIDAVNSVSIPVGEEISIAVSASPSAGMVWILVLGDTDMLSVSNPYGRFYENESEESIGFQVMRILCQDCEAGDQTYILMVLFNPWKGSFNVIRKVLINVN